MKASDVSNKYTYDYGPHKYRQTVVYFKVCSKEFRTTAIVYHGILMISRIIFRDGLKPIH